MASGSVAETLLPTPLVGIDWLARHLDAPDVKVLDGSWHMPATARDGRAEFEAGHIPGARFFDIDEIADRESPYPHMLPTADAFAAAAGALGLTNRDRIVIYDTGGLFGAARVWWMVRAFGHDRVAVLDGGLPKWLAEGRPVVEERPEPPRERHFTARVNNLLVKDRHQVARATGDGRTQLVDMRPADRFRGEAPEPRPGVRAGHVPGALNLPYTDLLDPMSGTVLDAERLEARILAAGIDPSKPVIAMCGSGVTAGMLALAMYLLGKRDVPVYDGSWADWGSDESLPIER